MLNKRRRPWRRALITSGVVVVVGASALLAAAGFGSLERKFRRELRALGPPGHLPTDAVSPEELRELPPSVQRYMAFMRVEGQPREASFRGRLIGSFRLAPDAAWLRMEAWQYNSVEPMARVFHLRIKMFGVVPVIARDTYLQGRGRMLVRPFDAVTLQDATGMELDVGELVTWLNDAILIAPSMLLGSHASFEGVDDNSFDVAVTDDAVTVKARVFLDERGAPVNFETTDRFVQDPYDPKHPWVRAKWTTPISGWQQEGDRMVPTSGEAVWHLPQGEFSYARMAFDPTTLVVNAAPGG